MKEKYQGLINDLIKVVGQMTDRHLFQCDSKGADNSKAIILQYKGEVPAGHLFLCDCIGNTIDLCLSTKRKYKNPVGRAVTCKVIATIIPDCHKQFGTALNGCWQIPYHLISTRK